LRTAYCLVFVFAGASLPGTLGAQVVVSEPDGFCGYDWSQHFEQLSRLFDTSVDRGAVRDHVTTASVAQDLAGGFETWYVAARPDLGDTRELFRLLSPGLDFKDSATAELGYSLDASLGQAWTDAGSAARTPSGTTASGMRPLRRYVGPAGDRRTWLFDRPPAGYSLEVTFDGFQAPRLLGYQRFGNSPTKAAVLGTSSCTPGAVALDGAGYGGQVLDNGLLRIDFNRVWGNAIGRITQLATCRQIVSEPIGDMVQTVVRFFDGQRVDGAADDPDCRNPNPTQSGGVWANTAAAPQSYSRTEYWAGSPVVSEHRSTSGDAQVLTTIVRPLEFASNGATFDGSVPWAGADPARPLAWKGFIERRDALGCKLPNALRRDVLASRSRLMLASDNALAEHDAMLLNTYWLKATDLVVPAQPVVWDFRVECKNLRTGGVRTLVAHPDGRVRLNHQDASCGEDDGDLLTPPDDHAVVVTRRDGTFGYAVVRLGLVIGEQTAVSFRCAASPCSSHDNGAVIIQPTRTQFTFPSRSRVARDVWSEPLESFLVVNNRAALLTRVDEIRSDGGRCLD
jgi:hypothetical protein